MTPVRQKRKNDSDARSYVLEDQIGFILRLAFQYHTSIFMSHMGPHLTQTQFATLSKIADMGGCSQSDLVRLIALDSATINGVVSRMKARGFIAISEDPADRRRQFLKLTKLGTQAVAQAQQIGRVISEDTLALLTPTERRRLLQLLRKLIGVHQGQFTLEPDPSPMVAKRRFARLASTKSRRYARSMRGADEA